MSAPYRTIVADPPWPLGDINAGYVDKHSARRLPYETLSLDAIRSLPVSKLCGTEAHLYLWTVAAVLRHSFTVVEAWGFMPKQVLVWAKPGLGTGGRFRQSCEYVLFATRGSTLPITRRDVGTWHSWPRGAHSAKPDAFYDLVESVSPAPYLELFARRQRLGWDTWGDQAFAHVDMAS